jgi:glucose-6-phosphate isomerase
VARLSFDYTCVLADAVGPEHGITEAELAAMAAPTRAAVRAVQGRRTKDLRWLDLPHDGAVRDRVLAFAAERGGRFENVVVLGIGGSALGTTACRAALGASHPDLAPAGPRLFVLDNVDPEATAEFLERVDPAKTLYDVISKSGGTAETMAQFLIFRDALIRRVGRAAHAEHLVLTTDARSGVLREIVRREGYAAFEVPDGVGGRFSVLSAVGLLPLALAGVDVAGLLAGAAEMDGRCRAEELPENPAAVHAAVQWLLHAKKHKPISVTFAYGQRLAALGSATGTRSCSASRSASASRARARSCTPGRRRCARSASPTSTARCSSTSRARSTSGSRSSPSTPPPAACRSPPAPRATSRA